MPTISIIVPVYKVEKYLPCCLESILAQTYPNFELILVDDGSPDHCGEICDQYAKSDERIHVIHQINAGVSAARNNAMKHAEGEYICFADSDDMLHPQMLEILHAALSRTSYPFVHCAFHRFIQDSQPEFQEYGPERSFSVAEMYSEQGMLRMMDWKTYGHYIWKGLYRREYIRNYSFPLNTRWEDIIWSGEIVGNAGKYGYVEADLYGYRINQQSLVNSKDWNTQKMFFSASVAFVGLTERLTPAVLEQVRLEVFQAMLNREAKLHKRGCLDKAAEKEIEKAAKACKISFLTVIRSKFSLRRKLIYSVCLVSFPIGCGLRRLLLS